MGDDLVGRAFYELSYHNDKLDAGLRESEGKVEAAGKRAGEGFARPMDQAAGRVRESIGKVAGAINSLSGRSPQELASQLAKAADAADEARAALQTLARADALNPAKARAYADALDEIGIEADQTIAELRQLQASDPRFNTAELTRAADQVDRVGREAREAAGGLNAMKGVRADTHLERVSQEAREAAGNLDRTQQAGGKLGERFMQLRGVMAGLGIALGAHQVLRFFGGAISDATKLQTATTGVRTVLGKASSEVIAFGENSADSFGISKRAAAEYGAVLGAQLKAAGFGLDAAAKETVNLEQKAADLASTFGGEVGDAVTAIGALLRGERDTVEKYGVSIKQVDVNARIASLGLDTSTAAASKNATAVASLSLLYEQTADATGQFARSSDLNAGVQARASAKIENSMAKLGDALLPLMAALTELSADVLPGVIDGLLAVGQTMADIGQAWATVGLNFGAMGDRLHEIADDTDRTFDEVKNRIAYYMREMGLSFTDAADRAEREFERTSDSYELTVKDIGETPGPARLRSIEEIAALMEQGAEAGADAAANEAAELPRKMADAMLAEQQDLTDAITELLTFMEQALTPAQVLAAAQGFLTSKAYRDGMNSDIPAVVAKTKELRDLALAQIAGTGLSAQVAWNGGAALINAWVGSMEWTMDTRLQAFKNHAARYAEVLGQSLPTAGPLQHPERGGKSIGEAWTGALQKELGPLKLPTMPGMGPLPTVGRGASASDVLGALGGPQLALTGVGGAPAPAQTAATAAPSLGGENITVHLTVQGLVRAETPEDIGLQARRAVALGLNR